MEATMPNPNKHDDEDFENNHWSMDEDDEDQDDDQDEDDEDDDTPPSKSKKKVADQDDDDDDDQDDEDEDDDDDDDEEKISVKKYKELQRASSKGTEKLIKVNKAYDEAMTHLSEIAEDPSKLIELHKKNPDSAEIILNKFYKGISIQQFRKEVLKENITGDEMDEETMERMYDKMVARKEAEKNAKIVENRLDTMVGELDPKTAKKVLKEYNDITDGMNVTPDKVKKYFRLAYYEAVGEKLKDDVETKYIKSTSAGAKGSGGKGTTFNDRENQAVNESLSFLEEIGVLRKKKTK